MRAVFDTVIFVRVLINPKGLWGRLLFEHSDAYVIVLSPEIVKEILDVINRPELHRRFPDMAEMPRMALVLSKLEEAEVVEPQEHLKVCRDPNDNKFFECAVAARADYIVSEDKDILSIGEFEGIRTVAAAEFIDLLAGR